MLQGGESLVSWWKRRLPLLGVFTGLKKGRTLRALSQAVMKLGSHEDTLEDFNLLKLHERRCRLAEELLPERFRGLTWVDLRAFLAMESVQVPVKLMKQVLEKRIAPPHAHRRRVSVCRSLDRHVPLSRHFRSHFGSSYGTRCETHLHHVSSVIVRPPAKGGIKILGTAVLRLPRGAYPIAHRTLPRLPRRS